MLHKTLQGSSDFNQRVDVLLREYEGVKGSSSNAERIKTIKLIQAIHKNNEKNRDRNATLGSCVYGLIKISGDFSLFSVLKKKSFLRRYCDYGSKLSELLQTTMDIQDANPLDDQQAFLYLTAFYQRLKQSPMRADGTLAKDKDAEDLIKDVEKYIKILQSQIAKKRPTYAAMLQNFSEIPERYKALGGSDAARDKYTQFTKILEKELNERYSLEAKQDREWSDAYAMRYAALLFVMEEIEGEYRYLSPEGGRFTNGSALYKTCKQALNINYSTKEVSDDLKRKYYCNLLAYVAQINLKEREKELQKWESQGFKDARKFFEHLQNALTERLADLIRKTKPGAISLSYLDIVTSTAASYGVTIALGKIATEVSLHGAALKYFNLLKPEAALLITLLTFGMKSIVSQKATSAVNTIIVSTVSQPVIITFSSAKKMGEFCYSLFVSDQVARSMEVVDDKAFMQALNGLPQEMITPEISEKLKYVVGYKREAALKLVEDVAVEGPKVKVG